MVNPWSKKQEELDLDFEFDSDNKITSTKTKNGNLHKAKKAKNDEFYTRLEDIDAELSHYPKDAFKDKVIFLPTDVCQPHGRVRESNFIKHFKLKALDYGYKALVATCLLENNPDDDNKYVIKRHKTSYYPGRQYNPTGKVENTPETPYYTYEEYYGHCPSDEELGISDGYGSGDFRSKHCTDILEESDIVVTNPPFSLFREFVAWLMKAEKKFIIIGNQNAITYKEFFPLLRDNKVWIGHNNVKEFMQSDGSTKKFGNICWFTNVDINKRHENLILYKNYTPEEYPKYDNYDAINVDKVKDIPADYDGVMGVPITFLDKFNPEQFEIVGISGSLANPIVIDGSRKSGRFYIDGKRMYDRIVIRKKAEI